MVDEPRKHSACRSQIYSSGHEGIHANDCGPPASRKSPPPRVLLILDKTDIMKTILDNFIGDDELEWENNPHICRMKERRGKDTPRPPLPLLTDATNPQSTQNKVSRHTQFMMVT